MKITKFKHACLLVEMPAPVDRTVLFDPGTMSEDALDVSALVYLDDILITHGHPDHYSPTLLGELHAKFPNAHITAPDEVVAKLAEQGITASAEPPEGVRIFSSPHENVRPLFPIPQEYGYHYLAMMSHPGDSHSFTETMPILALPIAGPWASLVTGLNLALRLKPRYVLPIHDWHLSDEARTVLYDMLNDALQKEGITFVPLETGTPKVLMLD